jgi:hypothetical protein
MDELDRAVNEQEATGVGQGEALLVAFPVLEPCIACKVPEARAAVTQGEIDRLADFLGLHIRCAVEANPKRTALTQADFREMVASGFKSWGLVANRD